MGFRGSAFTSFNVFGNVQGRVVYGWVRVILVRGGVFVLRLYVRIVICVLPFERAFVVRGAIRCPLVDVKVRDPRFGCPWLDAPRVRWLVGRVRRTINVPLRVGRLLVLPVPTSAVGWFLREHGGRDRQDPWLIQSVGVGASFRLTCLFPLFFVGPFRSCFDLRALT